MSLVVSPPNSLLFGGEGGREGGLQIFPFLGLPHLSVIVQFSAVLTYGPASQQEEAAMGGGGVPAGGQEGSKNSGL